jgi:hypothetical protein
MGAQFDVTWLEWSERMIPEREGVDVLGCASGWMGYT